MDANDFATAYALSTVAGLRPFLTLALASLAVHFGWLHPAHTLAALGEDGTSIVLGGLAVIEFLGDKVPGVDHVLHVLHFATKPIAAAILVGSTLPPDVSSAAGNGAMVLGALNALGIHAGAVAIRGGSSAFTLGFGNPMISALEDAISIAGVLLAILAPAGAAALAILLTLVIARIALALVRRVGARARTIA